MPEMITFFTSTIPPELHEVPRRVTPYGGVEYRNTTGLLTPAVVSFAFNRNVHPLFV